MSEMVKRVALAIQSEHELPEGWPERYARAAIMAMREPTDAMMEVNELKATPHHHKWILRADKEVWQAMIDAALRPEASAPRPDPAR